MKKGVQYQTVKTKVVRLIGELNDLLSRQENCFASELQVNFTEGLRVLTGP